MSTILKIFTVVFLICSTQMLFSQTDQEEMQAWMESSTPGKFHEMLASCDGDWNADITMWMAPDAPPMKTTGTVTNKMILDGRYQYATHNATMMGMPFQGISIFGYDNIKKKFVSSWMDNFGTGILNMEGNIDEATNTITLTGKQIDVMTGKEMDIKETFRMVDSNNQVMEMFMTNNSQEMKTMEINFTRK